VTLPNQNRQPGIIQVRVPELPFADPLTGTELLWLTQLGRSKKAFISTIASYIITLLTGWKFKTIADNNYPAVSGDRIATDTSGGTWTLALPLAVNVGDSVEVADSAGTWATQPLSLATQAGQTIEGLPSPMSLDVPRSRPVFVWSGTTWKVAG